MSNRWTQAEDDSTRLPEGFKRIGYDADTRTYTFCDANGKLYQGEPGVRYGVMKPIPSAVDLVEKVRPSAFARSPLRSSTLPAKVLESEKSPQTFQDFLPPELITSSTISEATYLNSNPTSTPRSSSPNSKPPLVDLVRKSTIPKMQGVVHSLRRSVTAIRRSRLRPQGADNQETEREESRSFFRRRGSTMSTSTVSALDRSSSVSTTRTEMSRHSVIPVHPLQHS